MDYRALIQKIVGPGYDPRHIEAMMRVDHSTLDHLTPSQFEHEARFAALCVAEGGTAFAEKVALSFGMRR